MLFKTGQAEDQRAAVHKDPQIAVYLIQYTMPIKVGDFQRAHRIEHQRRLGKADREGQRDHLAARPERAGKICGIGYRVTKLL